MDTVPITTEAIAMARYSISLPNGKKVIARNYMLAIRQVRKLPDETWIPAAECKKEELLRQYWRMMNNKISNHIAAYNVGRKWKSDWQNTVSQLAVRVNQRRVIIRERELPKEFRVRLKHRFYRDCDF
jgi:hypothetical protein